MCQAVRDQQMQAIKGSRLPKSHREGANRTFLCPGWLAGWLVGWLVNFVGTTLFSASSVIWVAGFDTCGWDLVQERIEAARAFGVGAEAPAPTFDPEEDLAEAEAAAGAAPAVVEVPSKGPTSAQLTSIKAAIANAATLDEVQRLENALKTGHVPSEFLVSGSFNQI